MEWPNQSCHRYPPLWEVCALFELFRDYLRSSGVDDGQVIALKLDIASNARYRNPLELDRFVRDHIAESNKQYYVLLDEIQEVKPVHNLWLVSTPIRTYCKQYRENGGKKCFR